MSYTPTVWKTGDIVSSVKLNKIEAELSALDEGLASAGSDIDDVETALESKANIDGYYEGMTVGNAEQLVATVGVEDSVPYNFRTTGGSADVGDRKTMEIVGGTVAWNQLADSISTSGDHKAEGWASNISRQGNVLTIATERDYTEMGFQFMTNKLIAKDHKYLLSINIKSATFSVSGVALFLTNGWTATGSKSFEYTESKVYSAIVSASDNGTSGTVQRFCLRFSGNSATGDEVVVSDATWIDLTQMFGSTIANYVYSLEQANAGAGVAWFKKLFPKPYYAYNAGELMSVKTSAYKSVGFNQWDEEWEIGSISPSDGSNIASDTNIRSKNYIPVLPGTTYYFKGASGISTAFRFYDRNKDFVGTGSVVGGATTTIPQSAYYMRFVLFPQYGTTYNHDICMNLHWDGERDGEYEAYVKHTYALDSDLELRGIPKLDADNQLYYDGDIYESDGAVTRKYGTYTFDGTEYFDRVYETIDGVTYYYFRFYSSSFTNKIPNSKKGMQFILSKPYDEKYGLSYWYSGVLLGDKTSWGVSSAYGICFRDDSYSDVTTFKAAITGMVLVYELETPTTETADPFQTPQIVNDFGTEEFVDARTIPIPVGHNSKYQANLRAKLEMAPNSPSGDGDYIVRQASGQNTYVPITFPADELPAAPTSDGNYVLKCTVSSGTATFEWEAQT